MVDWANIIQTVLTVFGGGVSVYAAIRSDIAAHAAKIKNLERSVGKIEDHLWERRASERR